MELEELANRIERLSSPSILCRVATLVGNKGKEEQDYFEVLYPSTKDQEGGGRLSVTMEGRGMFLRYAASSIF